MAIAPAHERLHERRRAWLAALGEPQRAFAVVHVAGTNGKGSTVAMTAAVLHAAGLRVGRFTSPDLAGPHERFWIDGTTPSPEALVALRARVLPALERVAADFPELPPYRPFEVWCACAWVAFAESGVQIAVVEAGMGGREDATNVFEAPELTAVTALGLDHALWLGPDLESVARHKAGIMKPGSPALTTARGPGLAVLRAEAARLGVTLTAVSPLAGAERLTGGWTIQLPDGPATLPLAGAYQLENAALVLAIVETLRARGWNLPPRALRHGLASVQWPGRCERVWDPSGGAWLLDGAHNPLAVDALLDSWGDPEVVVLAVQRTKAAQAMVAALSRGGRPLVVAPLPEAECWRAEELAEWAEGPVQAAPTLEAALQAATAIAPQGLRCVTGSLYLVGAVRAALQEQARSASVAAQHEGAS